ncbi:hypothetical protein BOTBODRAFT_52090 [Botryobasidium botryosum FD-172 SS1]|uniref:Uncharacterized protein n=1 Tax=Botryobasidium botryosum (strain FD-172 SS1) TaxID=930990 RepID=A0A067N439_BOTB1|nr:hypothetical protein BOTBODRAFT_52090 [Botryobasidium botryosum FD-172 SS1]
MITSNDKATAVGRNVKELVKSMKAATLLIPTIHDQSYTIDRYVSGLFNSIVWATVEYTPSRTFPEEERMRIGLQSPSFVVSWAVKLGSGSGSDQGGVLTFARVDPTRLFRLVAEMSSVYQELQKRGMATLMMKLPGGQEKYYLGQCTDGDPVVDESEQPPVLVPVPKSDPTNDPISFCIVVTTGDHNPAPRASGQKMRRADKGSSLSAARQQRSRDRHPDRQSPTGATPSDSDSSDSFQLFQSEDENGNERGSEHSPTPRRYKRRASGLQTLTPAKRAIRFTASSPSSRHHSSYTTQRLPPPPLFPVHLPSPTPPPSPVYQTRRGLVVKVLGIALARPFLEQSHSDALAKTVEVFTNLNAWKVRPNRPQYLTMREYEDNFPESNYTLERIGDWCAANIGDGGFCSRTYGDWLRVGKDIKIPYTVEDPHLAID